MSSRALLDAASQILRFLIANCLLLLLHRSEQALECEETVVASVSTAGPADEAAVPGIRLCSTFVCNYPQRVIV